MAERLEGGTEACDTEYMPKWSHIVAMGMLFAGLAHAGEPSFNRDVKPILSNKCFMCHGPDEKSRKGKLRLDIESEARRVLGADGELLARIAPSDPADQMPPKESGKSLDTREIEVLRAWVAAGAKYEVHWAFAAPRKADPPQVQRADWPRNEIDRFILARLEAQGIAPSPEADPITLLRRVSLDLVGLPPTTEQVAAFLADPAPDAYARVVERLLASPHFGERWGRHWLDAAHYADSNGYSVDSPRNIWPYRDWVIAALNSDMPFDRFTTEQLAGDLLPDPSRDQKIATGFLRNTMINEEGGIDKEEFRQEAVIDRVNTIGTVFLGLTLGCAKCHSHKYDPIEQSEYYRMLAFLNNDDETTIDVDSPEVDQARAAWSAKLAELRAARKALVEGAAERRRAWEGGLTADFLAQLKDDERAALTAPAAQRSDEQEKTALRLFAEQDPAIKAQDSAIDVLEKGKPKPATSMIVAARETPRVTHMRVAGDYTRPGDLVSPGAIAALHPCPPTAKTRLDLAHWLTARENPLTARVIANRLWMHLFGRGIVETEDDFGMQGTPPTHPELLDWLAVEFMDRDWSVKTLLREMVMSATYRQASTRRHELEEVDPRNLLLARQERIRLDAEIVRDNALAAAGVLNEKIGGRSVFPPQPDGVMTQGQQNRAWNASEGPDRYRRGMYTYFWRATPYPGLTVFDAPDAQAACTRRNRSNTPLQALTLLNDAAFVEMASELAVRLKEAPDLPQRIDLAFKRCIARPPADAERAILAKLYEDERAAAGEDAACKALARAILNLDEFITRE